MENAALFFDLDGTLFSKVTRQIPESALEALKKAKKKGCLVFANTGRTWCALPPQLFEVPFDGYLCGCGTYVVYGEEILFRKSLPFERGKDILRKMEACGIEGICEGTEDIYYPCRTTRFPALELGKERYAAMGLGNTSYIEERDFIYDKIYVYTDRACQKQEFWDYIAADMEAIDCGKGRYEVIQKGYSKATACELVRRKLQLSLDKCYVFGDSVNDLEMFRFGGHAIAMGNHESELEPYTEYVTGTAEEGGIAQALEHYGFV